MSFGSEIIQIGDFNIGDAGEFRQWLRSNADPERRRMGRSAASTTSTSIPSTNTPSSSTTTSQTDSDDDSETSTITTDTNTGTDTSTDSKRGIALYDPSSPLGEQHLSRIRQHLSMDPATPFDDIRDWLQRNVSVIRHLARASVAHPDSVGEQALGEDAEDAADDLLDSIMVVRWESPALRAAVRRADSTDVGRWRRFQQRERKRRAGGKEPRRKPQRPEERRVVRPGSGLSKECRLEEEDDDDDEEDEDYEDEDEEEGSEDENGSSSTAYNAKERCSK